MKKIKKLTENSPLSSGLLCFDFDGTIHSSLQLHPVAREFRIALSNLINQKGKWGINTGRSFEHLNKDIGACRFPGPPDFIVAREREVFFWCSDSQTYEVDRDWRRECQRLHAEMYKNESQFIRSIQNFVEYETEAQWVSEPGDEAGVIASSEDEMDEIIDFIDRRLSGRQLAHLRSTIYMRLTHPQYHKGTALRHVARYFNIKNEKTFAIGDGQNDLGMLSPAYCGMIACPANAVSEVKSRVKQAGGFVASLEVSYGVAEALEFYSKQNLS